MKQLGSYPLLLVSVFSNPFHMFFSRALKGWVFFLQERIFFSLDVMGVLSEKETNYMGTRKMVHRWWNAHQFRLTVAA